jgi:hypothetical protein
MPSSAAESVFIGHLELGRLKLWRCLLAAALLNGCAAANFDLGGPPPDEAAYADLFPYYVEDCAVSELRKKPGYGFEYSGGTGGHSVAYLNGVCTDPGEHYPVVRLCPAGTPPGQAGVGISAHSHFSNANWVAIPGRAFFFDGGQPADIGLTKAAYERTQAAAKAANVYDGVKFYDEFFQDRPPGWSRQDWMYEISVATDYAIAFGRGRYCARVPVDRAQMARVVDFLNSRNAIYRHGPRHYHWNVIEDNCTHLVHNALAAAGVWPTWPTDRFVVIAALDFPVPRNDFVNLVRRTNDLPLDDIDALYARPAIRDAVLRDDSLPTQPGALAQAVPPLRPNQVYDTDLQLIFYDDPPIGSYQRWFDAIFADPRYTDLAADLRHFASLYATIEANRQPLATLLSQRWADTADDRARFARFYERYYAIIARQTAAVTTALARLTQPAQPRTAGRSAAAPAAAPPAPPATPRDRPS